MSPTSKSKSKDRKSGKEAPKSSLKSSGHVNISSETPASGYNPVSGTFHTIETAPLPSITPLHVNGRFRNIDDADDHNGNSPCTGTEYDSISNNGSWSGESEDHKEKSSQPLPRQDSVPGADNDKREKIRQKNERKHQRQKERRAQELHERCNGYLMSRKLEALNRQLVAMGFSQERATMALILNEGRVEESVVWLLEGSEEGKKIEHNLDGGSNLKIDISVELARITELQLRYKASKQEVERAIVSCEGDLDKAEETIKTQKEEPPAVPSNNFQETGHHPTAVNSKPPVSINQISSRIQPKPTSSLQQQITDDKNLNYTKATPTVGFSVDPGAKTVQLLKKIPPKTDWAKPQQIAAPAADKRLGNAGSNPSASFSSPKTDAGYVAAGHDLRNLQLGSVKEPVTVMQRPQSINNTKQAPSTSITPVGWYPSSVETTRPSGFVPSVAMSRSISPSPNGVGSNQYCSQLQYQASQQQFMSSSSSMDSTGTKRGNGFRSQNGSPSLAPPSSLGLFCGIGSTGTSSSRVDWSTGSSMLQFDYSSVDWSVDRQSLFSRPEGLWTGSNYIQDSGHTYDSFAYGAGMSSTRSGASMVGLQDGLSVKEPIGGNSREWTSPFEERELFSIPKEIVAYPSL